jgi:hypothetical protein
MSDKLDRIGRLSPRRILARLLPLAALLATGCGADPSESSNGVAAGAFGRILFHLHPAAGPKEGENEFRIALEEISTGMPLEGAAITVRPRMPAMGHTVTIEPAVMETGGGEYDVSHVVFTMPGSWEVYVRASHNNLIDEALFPYDVR